MVLVTVTQADSKKPQVFIYHQSPRLGPRQMALRYVQIHFITVKVGIVRRAVGLGHAKRLPGEIGSALDAVRLQTALVERGVPACIIFLG